MGISYAMYVYYAKEISLTPFNILKMGLLSRATYPKSDSFHVYPRDSIYIVQ